MNPSDYARRVSLARPLRPVTCRQCGATFQARDSRATYCSNRCRSAARYRRVSQEVTVMNIRNRRNEYMRHLPMDRISKAELAAVAVSLGARLSGRADDLDEGAAIAVEELWALYEAGIIAKPRAARFDPAPID